MSEFIYRKKVIYSKKNHYLLYRDDDPEEIAEFDNDGWIVYWDKTKGMREILHRKNRDTPVVEEFLTLPGKETERTILDHFHLLTEEEMFKELRKHYPDIPELSEL